MLPPRDFPLPCTLRPGRLRASLRLLACLGFVLVGGWMVRGGNRWGYLVGGVFGLCVLVFALGLHPRAIYLHLDEAGFTYVNMFRAHTVRWADVAGFSVPSSASRLMVWNFVPDHPRTGRARSVFQALSGYAAGLSANAYGLEASELAARMNALCWRWGEPPAEPFFSNAEIARLVQGQPIGEPLPFDAADDGSVRRFYAGLVEEIERAHGLRSRVEWNHYGCGYASFVEAWFYPADGRASLRPFRAGEERHVGLAVLLSRLSRYFVLGQDEKTWSEDGGSGGLPDFRSVDDLTHPALLPLAALVAARLTAAGLRRLSRRDLAALLPDDVQVPTILSQGPCRQFDALFHWED